MRITDPTDNKKFLKKQPITNKTTPTTPFPTTILTITKTYKINNKTHVNTYSLTATINESITNF